MILLIFGLITTVSAVPAIDSKDNSYKDQYCTDPRTMRKHAAYTEWADAYSCTRHRCQPGGRNLAIYTVGCKRVEAPESAIECEEVVEDTNMQFPFCCTRLRCLVVVRGEVWTRVLGQPWEVLPAAPWSHMYKMKKPPPADTTFLPKTSEQGPIYELSEPESDGAHEKVLRSTKKSMNSDNPDCNDMVPRAAAAATPDIVIALSTNNDLKEHKKNEIINRRSQAKSEKSRHKRARKTTTMSPYLEEDRDRDREKEKERERERHIEPEIQELEDVPLSTEKPLENSDERYFGNTFAVSTKPRKSANHQVAWTEIPSNQWNEHEGMDVDNRVSEPSAYHAPEFQAQEVAETTKIAPNIKEEKPSTNLQALVDAIGTRMRDIENVVQRMSEKVHQSKPGEGSGEKKVSADIENPHRHHKTETKRPSTEGEQYKRFNVRNRGSKYLHGTDTTTEQPLFIEDSNGNGYFSDASNSIVRRANPPKEPPPTYMAPVENRRKAPTHIALVSDTSDDSEKKHKKHNHKKRRSKGTHGHKKHRSKDDKRKHFNRLSSVETDKNVVSLEDSSAIASN